MANIQEVDSAMETDSNSRPWPQTDNNRVTGIKEEDYEYESLLAPAFHQIGYDEVNDVEIVGSRSNRPKASASPASQGYKCSKCRRNFGKKGALTKHTVACMWQ